MLIAGLSSAVNEVSVGLLDVGAGTKVVFDYTLVGPQGKSENLIPFMKTVMEKAGFSPKDLDALAITQGPGSYSGLRGSVAAAKTMAHTLKLPLYGASTLEVIAYNYQNAAGTILVILPAVKDQFNVALFAAKQGSIKRLTEDLILTSERLDEFKKEVRAGSKPEGLIVADDLTPRGINTAKIGAQLFLAKEKSDPLRLQPKYSHLPKYKEIGRGIK